MENVNAGLVVLNYNDWSNTCHFVKQIKDYTILEKIVVVDNNSSDDSYEHLLDLRSDKVDVIKAEKNGGYGYGNNIGIAHLKERYGVGVIFISNPDVLVEEGPMVKCVSVLNDYTDSAVVAPRMINIDGTVNWRSAWRCPSYYQYLLFPFKIFQPLTSRIYYNCEESNQSIFPVECVAGSFFAISKRFFENNVVFDDNIFLYCEETLLGLKIKQAGLKTYMLNDVYFVHFHSVSVNKSIKKIKQDIIMLKSREYILNNYYPSSMMRRAINRATKEAAMMKYSIKRIIMRGAK